MPSRRSWRTPAASCRAAARCPGSAADRRGADGALNRERPRADGTLAMSEVEETTSTVAVARQPIFDRTESIAGFEILYRSLTGPFTDAEGATSTVIVQSLADIGLDRLVG